MLTKIITTKHYFATRVDFLCILLRGSIAFVTAELDGALEVLPHSLVWFVINFLLPYKMQNSTQQIRDGGMGIEALNELCHLSVPGLCVIHLVGHCNRHLDAIHVHL